MARMAAEALESARAGKSTATDAIDDAFWSALGGEGEITSKEDAEAVLPEPVEQVSTTSTTPLQDHSPPHPPLMPEPVEQGEGALFRLSDTSGEMEVKEVGRGELTASMLDPADVFICDPGNEVMVWVGEAASDRERRAAMTTVTKYLQFQVRTRAALEPISSPPPPSSLWNAPRPAPPTRAAPPPPPQGRPFTTPVSVFKSDAGAMKYPLWKSIFAN